MTQKQEKQLENLLEELLRVKWATAFAIISWAAVIFEIDALFMQ